MKNHLVTIVTSKGRFTGPKAIREHLGVDAARGEMAFTPIRGGIVRQTAGSLTQQRRRRR